ncbi:hypothetical protein ACVCAH_37820, partial [Micromonospora sp. LZ34]
YGSWPRPRKQIMPELNDHPNETRPKYDTAGDITVEIDYHEPEQEGAERYLQRTITLSEEPDPDDLKVMHDIAEKSPVTLLIQFAWSVRTEFVGPR